MPVQLPLDHLAELWPDKLRGTRVGALLHPASISAKLEHASRIFERHNGDVLLVDLQDVGARYYTFIWTMYLCMRGCEKARVEIVVLDRPNPINGVISEGSLFDPNYKSFVGLHPIPVRHGK